MRFSDRISKSGWGAVLLTVYSFGILHLSNPAEPYFYLIAVVPTLLVMFTAEVLSFKIIHFFAGGELQRSTKEVARQTRENFYEGTSEEIKNRVDDFDQRAYQQSVSILSGGIIAVTAPFFGYLGYSLGGLLLGIAASAVSLQTLSRRGIESLNELARGISKPYEAKHEN